MAKSKGSNSLNVLFVASEASPFAKFGELSEIAGNLPKELCAAGINAAIILPLYNMIDKKTWRLKPEFKSKTIKFSDGKKHKKIKFGLYSSHLPGSEARVFFIENKKILGGGGIYSDKSNKGFYKKNVERFVFFNEAIFACLENNLLNFFPQVVHALDWQGGYLLSLITNNRNQKSKSKNKKLQQEKTDTYQSIGFAEDRLKNLKSILTIHDVSSQGILKDKNCLKNGLESADIVTVVSPTYASEIQTKDYGAGLHRMISKKNPVGIICGNAPAKYFESKDAAKLSFQESHRLKSGLSRPLFGMVSEFDEQKGLHWILSMAPYLIEVYDVELAFAGFGEEELQDNLLKLMKRYPENVFVNIGLDDNLAHEIYASADFILAPHLAESSGISQMRAMSYGAMPVARSVGAFNDIIEHGKTGVLFADANEKALLKAAEEALMIFVEEEKLKKMSELCKSRDWSWKKSADEYLKIYKKLASNK